MNIGRFVRHVRLPHALAESLGEADPPVREDKRDATHGLKTLLSDKVTAAEAQGILRGVRMALDGEAPLSASSELDFATAILNYELYADKIDQELTQSAAKRVVRNVYYAVRPALPVGLRKHLQRIALREWKSIPFPAWPVDTTTERIWDELWKRTLLLCGQAELPFVWYWPNGHKACGMMTHDVETKVGRDFCPEIIRMESRYGIRSAFEVVPEVRYEVPSEFLQVIREGGCEVCVHGLNHDGRLFSSRAIFEERKDKINQYAMDWGAVGFRSPVLYRHLQWLQELRFVYDMSVPNVGHLDPQRGGCCTVMPYYLGEMVELPLTTIQDYSLYHVLNECSLTLWKKQASAILDKMGLISFIIHPDYNISREYRSLYEQLLNYLALVRSECDVWLALPREVAEWWRARDCMEVVRENGSWVVRGPHADRARVAFASLVDGRVVYRVPSEE